MNQPPANTTLSGNIGNAPINPQAEPLQSRSSNGLAQEEQQFYQQSGEQHKLMQNQQELGYLGKFFGSKASAPTNIAGLVVVISMPALLVTFPTNDSSTLTAGQERIIALIGTALAFIFGASTKKE